MPQFSSYEEFKTFHDEVHSDVWNQRIHLAAWVLGGAIAMVYPFTHRWWLFPLAVVVAFAVSVLGHLVIQPKETIVLNYPAWTLRADIEMFAEMARRGAAKPGA